MVVENRSAVHWIMTMSSSIHRITLTNSKDCRRRRSAIRVRRRLMRRCIRICAASSISSPTAMAATASPRHSRSRIRISPSCAPTARPRHLAQRISAAVVAAASEGYKLWATQESRLAMSVASMTGFARSEGHADGLGWVWEIKSVNSKSLDLRCRMPAGFDALEPKLRVALAERFKRGAINVSLTVTKSATNAPLRVNRAALAEIMALAKELAQETGAAPPRIDGLLALKGVLESSDETADSPADGQRQAVVQRDFDAAVDALAAMRLAEGKRLVPALEARLAEITALADVAERTAAAQPAAAKARLKEQITALLEAAPA